MSDVLKHHGILGMKWGVRRTPAQLGHVPDNNRPNADSDKKQLTAKQSGSRKKLSELSDEELRQRINRLNMEKQYDDLVASQKKRDVGKVKKLLSEAAENLGRKALGVAVDKIIGKISKKKFDINDWKGADIDDMDADTIQNVSKWYEAAQKIASGRKTLK